MSAKELLSLAERVEKASGESDAYLDHEIHTAAFPPPPRVPYDLTDAPDYCRSLDAAMTLVPEGWRLAELGETVIEGNDPWGARLLEKRFDGRAKSARGDAATPALALCAAALRARAAIADTRPKDEDASSAASLASGGGARQRNRPNSTQTIDIGGEG